VREKRYEVDQYRKKNILQAIASRLIEQPEISFAYLHGSFLHQDTFQDIDCAVYLSRFNENERLYLEVSLENDLEESIEFPIDLRILNKAPLSFQYTVLREGLLLFEKDEDIRVSFQEKVVSEYLDFAPLRSRYLAEVLGRET